jgi:hypothetical protein
VGRQALARAALPCLAAAWLSTASACSTWLFSGYSEVDRSRPVALIETTGGVEYGATTELGILMLGRSATEGPCRVRYFLGPTPMIEDGHIEATGSSFYRAVMDLRTMHLRLLDHRPGDEPLIAMWTEDGIVVHSVDVRLCADEGVEGDVLADPGQPLPAGAAVLADVDGNLRFVGLVTGKATLEAGGDRRQYYTFAGVDRVRELLAVPEVWPTDYEVHYRPDDIIVRRPIR